MSIQRTEFLRFVKMLSDNDCLNHVILIGSWAEYIYKETSMMPGFEPNIKTLDVDFLIKNMRKPLPPKNISVLAKEEGYLVDKDILNGTTKIFDRTGLEIEFLINKTGAGLENSIDTNLGVTAQSLRHLHVLLENTTAVKYLGMTITVPIPEAYVLHKIIINNQRGRKQEKDKHAVLNLWKHINPTIFNELYGGMKKKEQHAVEHFLLENNLTVDIKN